MEKPTSSETLGCGSSQSSEITLNIQTTTGGNFSITVDDNYTVDQLKKIISKKLKVPKDRICLLHRERQLRDGTLKDNGLMDGSRIILLPSVETGLLTQRPESSVMQALESLNDSQVNDFLSGKSPLNLTMRLGDHMMLIQLQLSTLNPISNTLAGISAARAEAAAAAAAASTPASTSKPRTFVAPPRSSSKGTPTTSDEESKLRPKSPSKCPPPEKSEIHTTTVKQEPADPNTGTPDEKVKSRNTEKKTGTQVKNADDIKSFLRKQDIETLQNAFEIFKSLAEMQEDMEKDSDDTSANDSNNQSSSSCSSKYSYDNENSVMDSSSSSADLSFEEQSPIKSLSNLVSSPLKSVLQSNYSPVSIPLNNKEDCEEMEDKPPPSIISPKYVPLPSSLKNNLIDSLVEEDPGVAKSPPCSPDITDPIAANLTSCLCSKLNPNYNYNCSTNCHTTSHTTAKADNPQSVMMDTDSCHDPVSGDGILGAYPEDQLINAEAEKTIDSVEYDCEPSSEDGLTLLNEGSKSGEKLLEKSLSERQDVSESTKNKRLHYLLHKTSKQSNPITQNKQKAFMQSVVNKHLKKKMQQNTNSSNTTNVTAQPSTSKQTDFSHSGYLSNHFENLSEPSTSHCAKETSVFRVPNIPTPKKVEKPPLLSASVSDTKALIEASKNLTQTLKKLSKEVLTSKVDLTNEENTRAKIGQGAVIESMKHHGKGIYSGTFSGTLNPALQDRFGRPKRDISTIIHILNDLLCATPPQYRRGARITFEPTHNTANSSARTKQRDARHQSQSASCSGDHHGSSECACSKCSGSSGKCPYGECNGHYPTPAHSSSDSPRSPDCSCKALHSSDDHTASCVACSMGRLNAPLNKCHVCLDKEKDDKLKRSNKNCKRCHSVSALALENSKTKCKLDHLRLVMQQKKQRREMRKMKTAPYVTPTSVTPLQADAPGVIAEEVETLA